MSDVTKRVKFLVGSEDNGAKKTFEGIESTANQLTATLGKLGLAFGAVELVRFGYDALKASTEVEVLRSSFKGTREDFELFQKAVAGGLDESAILKLSNYASDLNLTMKDQAIAFSLAEDAADKYGTSIEEGFNKFVLASEGSKKALKAIGISQAEYNEAIKSVLKNTGYRIEQLDVESQAEVRKQAIIEASGLTLEEVAKKAQDNADKIASVTVALKDLEVGFGNLLNSPIIISFFEKMALAVKGWAIILGGKVGGDNAIEQKKLEYASQISKYSKTQLEDEKKRVELIIQQNKSLANKGLGFTKNAQEYNDIIVAKKVIETEKQHLEVIKDIDKWKKQINETNKVTPFKLSDAEIQKQKELSEKLKLGIKPIPIEFTAESSKLFNSLKEELTKKGLWNKETESMAMAISFNVKDTDKLEGIKKYFDFGKRDGNENPLKDAMKMNEGNQQLIEYWQTATDSIAMTLQDGIGQAFDNIFGEANSLLEQFISNLVSSMASLATQKVGAGLLEWALGGFKNNIFDIIGSLFSKMQADNTGGVTIVKIGDETVARVVNNGYNRAQRLNYGTVA